MKRPLQFAAAVLVLALAASGCGHRARAGLGGRDARPAPAATTGAPGTAGGTSTGGTAGADADLSAVDGALAGIDDQLTQADTSADDDR